MPPTPTAIDRDIHCIQCGYNLRGLEESGRCPECGSDVAATLQHSEGLRNADPKWLRSLATGAMLYLLAWLLWEAGVGIYLAFAARSFEEICVGLSLCALGPRPWLVVALPRLQIGSPAVALLYLALAALLQWVGVKRLARKSDAPVSPSPHEARRTDLRMLVGLTGWFSALAAVGALGDFWVGAVLGLFALAADTALVLSLNQVFSELAERANCHRLARRTRRLGLFCPCFAVGSFLLVVVVIATEFNQQLDVLTQLSSACMLLAAMSATAGLVVCLGSVWRTLGAVAQARFDT